MNDPLGEVFGIGRTLKMKGESSMPSTTPTPTESRNYVAPDSSGIATGTSAADDIYATGDGQTLIGGVGDDIFNIGTHTGLTLQESKPGISTVSTYLGSYVLPDGIDNLTAAGGGSYNFTGNLGNNVITGSTGNDTLNGGGGTDLLIGGGGVDTFVIDRQVAYQVLSAGPVEIADFDPSNEVLDMRDYLLVADPAGTDPFADGTLSLQANSSGGTDLVNNKAERSAGGAIIPIPVVTFDHVAPGSLTAANFITGVAASPSPAPTPTPSGSDTLVLHLSEDAYNGDAQFTVALDGVTLGSPTAVSVLHSTGQFQDFTYSGNFGAGPHTVAINFVNDSYGGSPSKDRNLYVGGIDFDGQHYAGTAAQDNASGGATDPNDAPMFSNGTVTFGNVTGPANPPTGQVVTGGPGNDTLHGTAGNDTLLGLDGNDVLVGSPGADTLDGGPGLDIVDYSASPASVTVDLGAGTASGGDAQGDTLIGIDDVRGSAFADVITGDGGANLLEGGGGDDTLHGGGGDDILIAGERGNGEITDPGSHFTGGELFPVNMGGHVLLDGGTGNDTLIGGANTTFYIHNGNGDDIILNYVAGGTVDIDGYAIGDKATLMSHATYANYTATIDLGNGETLTFERGPHPPQMDSSYLDSVNFIFTNVQPTPSPSPGPSSSAAGPLPTSTPTEQRSYVAASNGVATGSAGADDIFASANGQTLTGNGGDDIFHTGTYSNLTISEATAGTSVVSTYAASFVLPDPVDNLSAAGTYGHALTGNAGANVVTGNSGNDTLDGAGGNDLLIGNGGSDTYKFAVGGGADTIVNGTGSSGKAGELDFGSGIASNQLWLAHSGNDLVIDRMGSADSVTVSGWYASQSAQLQTIATASGMKLDAQLDNLVQAMASFSANNPGFDPTAVSQAPNDPNLQASIAASWHA
ncbi:MAG: Hemolysin-type calcium-binding protein [Rhodospirillales bacterium]|nr:Hemolysin-type calcium-binding protein [Rhodospirillales bacterium]